MLIISSTSRSPAVRRDSRAPYCVAYGIRNFSLLTLAIRQKFGDEEGISPGNAIKIGIDAARLLG